jgi:uncharacterized membrane protein YbhN (UPF0104 family)
MKLGKAAWGYGLIILVYLTMLLWVDAQKGFFELLPTALRQLPALMFFAMLSFGLRYARWFFLLRLAGSHVPVGRGWLAYLSGFAFTATPGKVGELVRIRYFGRLQVNASRVLSAFVFERALDLLVVLGLASLWVVDHQMLGLSAAFVFVLLLALGWVMLRPDGLGASAAFIAGRGWLRLARLLDFVAEALMGCRVWLKPWPLLVSVVLGLGAWSVTAYAFVHLLDSLRLDVPGLAAFSAYPLAMLVGAASMLPGGVGSTEAAIVVQLQWQGVPVATALLAAVVVRLGTMWFSVVCGLAAVLVLELKRAQEGAQESPP